MLIQQNFSVAAGDDVEISLDIDPDVQSLVGTNITFRAHAQQMAVPLDDPVLVKNLDNGLQITDPDYGLVLITFNSADTIDLPPSNYSYEITLYDGAVRTTVTKGIMTVTQTSNPQALT